MTQFGGTVADGDSQTWTFTPLGEPVEIVMSGSGQPYTVDFETKLQGQPDSTYSRIPTLQQFGIPTVQTTGDKTFETNEVTAELRLTVTNNSGGSITIDGWYAPTGRNERFVEDGNQWIEMSRSSMETVEQLNRGNIVVVGDGVSPTVVDPGDSTTPVQDAIDIIGASNSGQIYLPPVTIQEAGPLHGGAFKRFIGCGITGTVIEFTHGGDGVEASSTGGPWSYCYLDGLTLEGQAGNEVTNCIHWVDDAGPQFNLGQVRFRNYDTGMWAENDSPWSSHWESIYGGFGGQGPTWQFDTGGMTDIQVGQATLANDNEQPCFQINGDVSMHIGTLQCERSLEKVGRWEFSSGELNISQLAVEVSDGGNEDLTQVGDGDLVSIISVGNINIGQIRTRGMTINNVIDLEFNPANVRIGRVNMDGTTVNDNTIAVNDDPLAPILYDGPVSEVDNNTGSVLSNPVVTTVDVTKKFSTGTGYDGGTEDSQL